MKAPRKKQAWSVTVGEKGQIVIPKGAREMFDIRPGDTLLILGDSRRGLAIPPKHMFEAIAGRVFKNSEKEEEEEE